MTTTGVGIPELLIICIITLIILALLAALVVGIVLLTRKRPTSPLGAVGESSALAILKERYARGEITQEQFEAMKRDIEK